MSMQFAGGRRFRRFWAALAAGTLVVGSAGAQTWSNGAGGAFETGTNWIGGTAPSSSLTTALIFGDASIAGSTYTATNNTANFNLNSLVFNNTGTSVVTLAGSALNFAGTTPVLTVGGTGSAVISAPVNIIAPAVATNADYSLRINMNGAGSLTIAGALGGSITNGTGANADVGFSSFGTGTGTLRFTGGGSTGFLRINNANVIFDGGTYNVAAAGNDTPNPTALTPPPSSPLIFAQNAGDNVTAIIRNGTVINSFDNGYFGNLAGSVANVTFTGAGTTLNLGFGNPLAVSGRFGPGNNGTGNVTVSAGAQINAYFVFQSRLTLSSSIVIVDGAGSRIFSRTEPTIGNSGQFAIGNQSVGTWTVQNGGSSVGRNFILGNTALTAAGTAAETGLGNGTLTVTGAGSTVIAGGPAAATTAGQLVAGNMTVGSAGNGRLNVLAGGVVNINTDGAAAPAGGSLFTATNAAVNTALTGRIDVDGTGSQLNVAGQFSLGGGGGVGLAGVSAMNITAGGRVAVGGTSLFGQNATATPATTGSTTVITGANSIFAGTGQIQMNDGLISVSILAGGAMTSGGTTFIGSSTVVGGTVSVIVGGTNSLLSAPLLAIGGQGTVPGLNNTTLTVNTGGTVTSTNLVNIYGLGNLNVAGGTVNAGSVNDGVALTSVGNTTLGTGGRLNLTGLGNGTYSGIISGAGNVVMVTGATGIQTFSGQNTYTGGTTINAGTLSIINTTGSGTGTGAVAINSGGTFSGTGISTSAVAVNAGSRITGGLGVAVSQSLTVASAVFDGTSNFRIAVAEGAGTVDNTIAGASRLAMTGAFDVTAALAQGTAGRLNIELVLSGTLTSIGTPYTRTIGTYGSLGPVLSSLTSPINIAPTDPQIAIVPIGFAINQTNWLVTISGGNIVVNFTPVPEPASILLLAGAGGLFVRRLRNRRAV